MRGDGGARAPASESPAEDEAPPKQAATSDGRYRPGAFSAARRGQGQ